MKIALINNVNYGSTGEICKSISTFVRNKGNECNFYFALSKGPIHQYEFKYSSKFFQIFSALKTRLFGKQFFRASLSTFKLVKLLKKYKPDLVNIHCCNAYSLNFNILCNYLQKNEIPVVLTGHALFYSTGCCAHILDGCDLYFRNGCDLCPNNKKACKTINRFYKSCIDFNLMKNAFSKISARYVGVSDFVTNIAKLSPLNSAQMPMTILNGVDSSIFNYRCTPQKNRIAVLFVCSDPQSPHKGFAFFNKLINLCESKTNIEFHYVGPNTDKLKEKVVNHGCNLSKKEIADLYNECSITILLSKNETFSLPVAESLMCGTPVVAFKCHGPETIAIDWCCKFFDYGDIDSVANYIKDGLFLTFNKKKIADEARAKFDLNKKMQEYFDLFKEIVDA